jgi:hypothetical protein
VIKTYSVSEYLMQLNKEINFWSILATHLSSIENFMALSMSQLNTQNKEEKKIIIYGSKLRS